MVSSSTSQSMMPSMLANTQPLPGTQSALNIPPQTLPAMPHQVSADPLPMGTQASPNINIPTQTLPLMPHQVSNNQLSAGSQSPPTLDIPPQTLPLMPHQVTTGQTPGQTAPSADAFQRQANTLSQTTPTDSFSPNAAQAASNNATAATGQQNDMNQWLNELLKAENAKQGTTKADTAQTPAEGSNGSEDAKSENTGNSNNEPGKNVDKSSLKDMSDEQLKDLYKQLSQEEASRNPKAGHVDAPEKTNVDNTTAQESKTKTEVQPKDSTVTVSEENKKTTTQKQTDDASTQQPQEKKSSLLRFVALATLAGVAIWGAVKGVNYFRNGGKAKDAVTELAPEESKNILDHVRDWVHGDKISAGFKNTYYDLMDKVPGMNSTEIADIANQVKLDTTTRRRLSQAIRWEQALRQAERTRAAADPVRMHHVGQAKQLITSYKLGVINRAIEQAGTTESKQALSQAASDIAKQARLDDIHTGNLVREDLLRSLGTDPSLAAEAELNLFEALIHMRKANVMSDHRLAGFAHGLALDINTMHPNRFGAQVLIQRARAWRSSTGYSIGSASMLNRSPENSFKRLEDSFYNLRRL